MTDDVIARAKAEYAGFGEHFPNDLAADLIALAESQAAEIKRLRTNRDYWMKAAKYHGDCICDHNPSTTDGPQEFCPEHGRPYPELLGRIDHQAAQLAAIREINSLKLPGMQVLDDILAILDGTTDAENRLRRNPGTIRMMEAAEANIDQAAEVTIGEGEIPDRTFTDDRGHLWEWCGGQPGTWAWRRTAILDGTTE